MGRKYCPTSPPSWCPINIIQFTPHLLPIPLPAPHCSQKGGEPLLQMSTRFFARRHGTALCLRRLVVEMTIYRSMLQKKSLEIETGLVCACRSRLLGCWRSVITSNKELLWQGEERGGRSWIKQLDGGEDLLTQTNPNTQGEANETKSQLQPKNLWGNGIGHVTTKHFHPRQNSQHQHLCQHHHCQHYQHCVTVYHWFSTKIPFFISPAQC